MIPGTAGADDADLFRELSGVLRIPVILGSQADAESSGVERIVFVPERLPRPGPLKLGAPDGDGIAEQARRYKVSIYGSDWGRLCRLHRELYAALDAACSPSAFMMGDSEVPQGGGPGLPSWGVVVPVSLMGPIYRSKWIPGTSTTVTGGLFVTKPDGTGSERVGGAA